MDAPSYIGFFLLFILLTSCSQKEEASMTIPVAEEGTALYHYQQRAFTKDRREKLFHINQGLKILESKEDTLYVDLLRHKTINHYYLDELDSTVNAASDLIIVAGDEELWNKARGHFFRGWAFIQLGKNEASFQDSFRAKELFLQLQDSAYAGRAWFNMATAQQNSGDYSGAQQSAIETLKFLNPEKDSSFISSAYNEIGRSYLDQNLYTDAINSFQKASEFSRHNKSKTIENANIGYALNETGAVKEAIEIFESLLTFDELSLEQKVTYQLELDYLKYKQDPSLDISEELEIARQFFINQHNLRKLQLTYEYLINFNKQRNPYRAIDYARKQLKAAKTYGNPQSTLDALENLVELESPEESKTYALEYIQLSDSLSTARMRTRNLFAKIQYDEEQKELEILDLERENALQLAHIAQQQQRMTIIGAVAFFLILGTIFILYVFRLRHRREKQLQVYTTESRIAKKVHDELANDIYVVMTQLENKITTETSDKLEHIYERTRDISRENSKIQTGAAFDEELHGMLHSYMPPGTRFLTPGFEEMPWNSLSAEKQIAVYRSLQELMTNMKKHSQAKVVVINFNEEKNWMLIRYADRGVGIETDKLKYKHGLKNVENRISAIAGTFTFESTLGDGVKAEIIIPL